MLDQNYDKSNAQQDYTQFLRGQFNETYCNQSKTDHKAGSWSVLPIYLIATFSDPLWTSVYIYCSYASDFQNQIG